MPAYTQLFREDGSRLADEGEDLPSYPGGPGLSSRRGTITGPELPAGSRRGSDTRFSLIAPSEIVDESINPEQEAASEAAARENEQDYRDVIEEHIDLDADLPDMEDAAHDVRERSEVPRLRLFDDNLDDFGALLTEHLTFASEAAASAEARVQANEERAFAQESEEVDRMFDSDVRRTDFDQDGQHEFDFDGDLATQIQST